MPLEVLNVEPDTAICKSGLVSTVLGSLIKGSTDENGYL